MQKNVSLVTRVLLGLLTVIICHASVVSAATVAHWRFEEGSDGLSATGANSILDSSGNNLHGTPYNNPVYRSVTIPESQMALEFNGTNTRIFVPDDPLLKLNQSFTLEAIVRVDSVANALNQIVFRGDDRSSYDPYFLMVDAAGDFYFRVTDVSNVQSVLTFPAPMGQRTHVAATLDYSTGSQRLYVDGVLVASKTTSVRPLLDLDPAYSPGLGIGNVQSTTFTQFFDGTIDEVRISTGVLAPSEFLHGLSDVDSDNIADVYDNCPTISNNDQADADSDWMGDVCDRNDYITTVAGDGTVGNSGDGGTATAAQLNAPYDVAFDASGNMYIADNSAHVIRKVDVATKIITTVVGTGVAGFSDDGGLATSAQINGPDSVAVDAAGNLYISDSGNLRIRKVDVATGNISTIAGTGAQGFDGDGVAAVTSRLWGPADLGINHIDNNLYISDSDSALGNERVRMIDLGTGIITTVAGNGTRGYSGDGGPATSAQLNYMQGLDFDPVGNILIADMDNHRIRKVEFGSGIITTVAGSGTQGFCGDGGPATGACFNYPSDVAVDNTGHLYIADIDNNRIRRVDAISGIISTIAGTGSGVYSGDDGLALVAGVPFPYHLTTDQYANIFVAEEGLSRVRRIGPLDTDGDWVGDGDDPDDDNDGVSDGDELTNGTDPLVANAFVPKTGQTTCYDSAGSVIACAGTGHDGELQEGVAWPDPRFTDNGDGTVSDHLTGLIWLKNAGCFVSQSLWSNALSSSNNLANGACGLSDGSVPGDWRLPNINELESLIDHEFNDPALLAGHPFLNVQNNIYWSSSTYPLSTNVAWTVDMDEGEVFTTGGNKLAGGGYVWPVRDGGPSTIKLPQTGQSTCYDGGGNVTSCTNTGQDGERQKGVVWPSLRFVDNNDGTVTDHLTGLVWLQDPGCFDPQTWDAALTSITNLANGNCGLTEGSAAGDWRMPNRFELSGLFDRSQTPNFSVGHPFEGAPEVQYWSSTSYASSTHEGWLVNMYDSAVYRSFKSTSNGVWAVRGYQPVANHYYVTPSVGANGSLSPATTVFLAEGQTTSFDVTVNEDYAIDSISGCGGSLSGSTYTTGAIYADCTVSASFVLVADGDGDNVGDSTDNCPALSNPAQVDTNTNDVGDLCESVKNLTGNYYGVEFLDDSWSTGGNHMAIRMDLTFDGTSTGYGEMLAGTFGIDPPFSFTYAILDDNTLVADDGGDIGTLSYNENLFVIGDTDIAGEDLMLMPFLRKGSGMSVASLSGTYSVVEIADEQVSLSPLIETAWMDFTFDGAGNISYTTVASSAGSTDSGADTYTVAADGLMTLFNVTGSVSADGNVIALADTDASGDDRTSVLIGVKKGTGMTTADLSGAFILHDMGYELGTTFASRARLTFDGTGQVLYEELADFDNLLDPPEFLGYSVAADGTVTIGGEANAVLAADGQSILIVDAIADGDVGISFGVKTTAPELDSDGDGIGNALDNCPNDPNADQLDTDSDGVGDACDLACDSLIVNGDFSLGNVGFETDYLFGVSTQDNGTACVDSSPLNCHPTAENFGDHTDGSGLMFMANGKNTPNYVAWRQTVAVEPNTQYHFQGWATSWGNLNGNTGIDPSPSTLHVYVNGVEIVEGTTVPAENAQWVLLDGLWYSEADVSATITVVDSNIEMLGNDFSLDDFSFFLDSDGDAVSDCQDNCSLIANADQANFDGDALGDACDDDDDNDGLTDEEELANGTDPFNPDITPPVVSISSPVAGTSTNQDYLLSYSVNEGSVTVLYDGNVIAATSGDTLSGLLQGQHTITVRSIDAAGNIGHDSVTFTVDLQTLPPVFDPLSNPWNETSYLLSGQMEEGATVAVSVPGATVGGVSYPTTTSFECLLSGLATGSYAVSATATDGQANTSDPANATLNVELDIPAPALSVVTDTFVGGTVTVDWSAYADVAAGFAILVGESLDDLAVVEPFRVVDGTTFNLTIEGLTNNVITYIAVVPLGPTGLYDDAIVPVPVVATRQGVGGFVTDSVSGDPLAGILVSVSGQGSVVTDADGGYLYTGLPAGAYTLTVGESGGDLRYTGSSTPITIPTAAVLQQDMALLAVGPVQPSQPQNLAGMPGNGKATLTWEAVTDVDLDGYIVYRDGSPVNAQPVASNTYVDTGLSNGVNYTYTVSAVNQTAVEGPQSGDIIVQPILGVPDPATDLAATLNCDGSVTLEWAASPTTDVDGYGLYKDSGLLQTWATTDNATFNWTSASLAADAWYSFYLKAYNGSGFDAGSAVAQVYVPGDYGIPQGGIKIPKAGKRVSGNNLHVQAEANTCGLTDLASIRFQYRAAGDVDWLDIPAELAQHPNPDLQAPYFTKWDVTGLAEQDYELRAVATASNGMVDPAPAVTTITVDHQQPEYVENRSSNGGQQAQGGVAKGRDNSVTAGGRGNAPAMEVLLPKDTLDTDDTLTVKVPTEEELAGKVPGYNGGSFIDVSLGSGQKTFDAGFEPQLNLPYEDANGDGIIDGKGVHEDDLYLGWFNPATGNWEPVPGATVDKNNKKAKGNTGHFSLFGLQVNDGLPTAATPTGVLLPKYVPNSYFGVYWTREPGDTTSVYEVQEALDPAFTSGVRNVGSSSSNMLMVTGKSDGLYFYRVRKAKSGHLPSDWKSSGDPVDVTRRARKPGELLVAGYASDGRVDLVWKPSRTPGVHYELQVSDGGAYTALANTAETSYAISGLSAGRYQFRVRAVGDGLIPSPWRDGHMTAVVSYRTDIPGAMTVQSNSDDGKVVVWWHASRSEGAVYDLEVSSDGGSNWAAVLTDSSALQHTYTAPANGSYRFRVRAGKAGFDESIWRTGNTACQVAIQVLTQADAPDWIGKRAKVYWDASKTAGVTYTLQAYKNGEGVWTTIYSNTASSFSASGLTTGHYLFRVRAEKDGLAPSAWTATRFWEYIN